MDALERFFTPHAGVTSTANGSSIEVAGVTLGSIFVDDAASGTFTIVAEGRNATTAE